MGDSRAAPGFDRLPWLDDEPAQPAKRGRRHVAGWAIAMTIAVAGGSYWLGQRSSAPDTEVLSPGARHPRGVTRPQPDMRTPPEPAVQPVPQPEVRPAPIETVRPVAQRELAIARPPRALAAPRSARSAPLPSAAEPPPLPLWPARRTMGANGRIVQIGAYGTRLQAKRGWRSMVRAYPAMRRLPAVVVKARNSKNRQFYRFQIGTTSQAHSEILCQRMEMIRLSCAVVGLPWKPRGVER